MRNCQNESIFTIERGSQAERRRKNSMGLHNTIAISKPRSSLFSCWNQLFVSRQQVIKQSALYKLMFNDLHKFVSPKKSRVKVV